jgi:hypothetical protein
MKNFLYIIFLFYSFNLFSQDKHLTSIYDFKGADFDTVVVGMIGCKDSLFVATNSTLKQSSKIIRMDRNGEGVVELASFDASNYEIKSFIINDSIIYGTTRVCSTGSGSLFSYSLKNHQFQIIKIFDNTLGEIEVKYVENSLIWCISNTSELDFYDATIFTINLDGTNLTKIYNNFDPVKGFMISDLYQFQDSLYVSCYGGGNKYPDGPGTTADAGLIYRIHKDGSGYQKIIDGGLDKGTNPQSIIVRDNKIFGQFAYSGNIAGRGGQFFKCNLDGTAYDSIGGLVDRSLTKLLSTDSLLYGISSTQIFGLNPYTNEMRIFEDLLTDASLGFDMTINPVKIGDEVFIATQQGGTNGGGTILRWNNQDPFIKALPKSTLTSQFDLKQVFNDPESDSLNYYFEYDPNKMDVVKNGSMLELTLKTNENSSIKITASDGWLGYKSFNYNLGTASNLEINNTLNEQLIHPNPTSSILFINQPYDKLEIFDLNGNLVLSESTNSNIIDLNQLNLGVYLVKHYRENNLKTERLIKM